MRRSQAVGLGFYSSNTSKVFPEALTFETSRPSGIGGLLAYAPPGHTAGRVQAICAHREEAQCNESYDWPQHLLDSHSSWMLEHAEDEQGQEQPRKDAYDRPQNEKAYRNHVSLQTRWLIAQSKPEKPTR